MINTDMRDHAYYLFDEANAYGQPKLMVDENGEPKQMGYVKMAVNIASKYVQDSVIYGGAQYIGLTHAELNDKYVIQYEDQKLKVLYVNPRGRFKQVFMAVM
jgi:hypothetical protein